MIKKKFFLLIINIIFVLITTQNVSAVDKGVGEVCSVNDTCPTGYSCQPTGKPNENACKPDTFQGVFGRIKPPDALKGLISQDASGAGGISQFLSNLILLIYTIAAVVLIFMLLWGAFDWMTSEGDKEKLTKAQQKIISAIIGILLFAVAFAVIRILGQFTGFTFFAPKP